MITEQELLSMTPASTYAKGRDIFQKGNVQLQTQSATKISGLVSGSYDYQTAIYHDNGQYTFSCTCPAIEYQEVCKHCVAMALAAQFPTENKTESARNNQLSTAEEILKQYIESLPNDKKSLLLYNFICEEKQVYNRWLTKAKLASNQQDLKSLKKLVTKALPLRDIWEYHKAAEYFTVAEQTIHDVLESAVKLSPEDELKLIFQVYDRLEKILERVDDSGGYRFDVQYQLGIALCSTISRQKWDASQKAQWLNEALNYEYENLPEIPGDFHLTEAEMDAFLTICQTQFDQFEVSADISSREINYDLKSLGNILLSHLPAAKHYDTALKIKSKMATDLHDALSISQFCLENDDELTAEDWLLNAKKLFTMPHHKSSWNEQAIKVYAALGETKRAWQLAWQRFTDRPGYLAWQHLQKDVEIIGYQPDSLKKDVEMQLLDASKQANSKRRWVANEDIVYFYLSENQLKKSVNWLDNNKAGVKVLSEAAIALAPHFPEHAVNYCERALSDILLHAGNTNYQEAVALLTQLDKHLPDQQRANHSFESLIRNIANENSRRPNMMKLLRSSFEHYL